MDKRQMLIDKMQKRGYRLVEHSVYNIAERIRKYDNELVLFFNPFKRVYEVHTSSFITTNRPTYCISAENLDYELILRLKKADNRTEYGMREKFDDIEKSYEKEEMEKEKRFADMKEDILRRCEKKFFAS